ncbi:molybdopterin-dependent oxidoreductase [Actibacterium ureilyticum]|uniref:molybdopterin-dependent oxidoreductase n=1 Tax=Actibacterium ureilyticum TaxID=1590614 RepID=UPI001FEBF57C|nr:molybdopterin-dependent oxidoreductase [Actibacterium ureilyticum]
MYRLKTLCVAVMATLMTLTGHAARAEGLPAPTGEVILTVTGNITQTNAPDAAQFDLEMLQALDASEIVTDTIWTEGEQVFVGVRLNTLLEHVGAQGETLAAVAINDYAVEIPVSDATDDGPIVAYALNGNAMHRREKGPLWVIYPYAASNKFRSEVIYSRSIWQLDRIDVKQ